MYTSSVSTTNPFVPENKLTFAVPFEMTDILAMYKTSVRFPTEHCFSFFPKTFTYLHTARFN